MGTWSKICSILSIHLLALGTSVGTLLWFDLRLLGFAMRSQRVSEVYRNVMPWMVTGFVVMFISGGLLFWSLAAKCYGCHGAGQQLSGLRVDSREALLKGGGSGRVQR